MSRLLETVAEVIAEDQGVPVERIHAGSRLAEDLGIEGLQLEEVVIALEEEFEVQFSDEHVCRVDTVEDLVDLVAHELSRLAAADE